MWTPPGPEETVTCEDRTDPGGRTGVEQLVLDMESSEDRSWRRFYHALEVEQDSEEDVEEGKEGILPIGVLERGFLAGTPGEVPLASYHPFYTELCACYAERTSTHTKRTLLCQLTGRDSGGGRG